MPETEKLKDAAEGLATVFGRLAEFFHILDLSFFVSGASTLGALLFLRDRLGYAAIPPLPSWVVGLGLAIAAYVCGLVAFALGRLLNGRFFFRRPVLFRTLNRAISDQALAGAFLDRHRERFKKDGYPVWRLYLRLWQQLAARHAGSAAFRHLSRYWAMAAIYDGLAVSLLVWAVAASPVAAFGTPALSELLGWLATTTLLLAAGLCFYQGAQCYEFQVEDLVGALAVLKSSVD